MKVLILLALVACAAAVPIYGGVSTGVYEDDVDYLKSGIHGEVSGYHSYPWYHWLHRGLEGIYDSDVWHSGIYGSHHYGYGYPTSHWASYWGGIYPRAGLIRDAYTGGYGLYGKGVYNYGPYTHHYGAYTHNYGPYNHHYGYYGYPYGGWHGASPSWHKYY
ncbi:unnamed protein product [Acanthoscelides obtectus]|uniref:Uncharacterized protein n=1 Tax=Acanthoscelides obtectus TaxID=200917 RepID=A0A9P0LA27_ACAOB|nr:unnamed protein product [Acanthoscelides obtectus]CAK1670654.1 hypothetical protein AOBTE_LOCUS27736 [Acanthoscelides obtectus]